MTPCSARIDLKDRPDRGVELGVHQHDVLAVLEGFQRHVGAEFDRAGRVDDHVDVARSGQQQRILGRRRTAGGDIASSSCDCDADQPRLIEAGIAQDVERPLRLAVGDRDDAHARRAVDDLVGQALAHEAGADDGDADRLASGFRGLQGCIDEQHGGIFLRA